jgi:hypothetical protein
VSYDIRAGLGLPIETAQVDPRFASVDELSLPIEATPGLPIMIQKHLIHYEEV